MGADFGSFADLFALYLKSILFPTNTLTADGTTSCISGYHFIRIFLLFFFAFVKEDGSITENAIKKTSVPG